MERDPYDLQRFVDAQDPVFAQVLAELAAGAKCSHWMWFVFPQLAALGRSETARLYGLASLAEARAYAEHPVLGPRLRQCAALLWQLPQADPVRVLGSIDALKLRSCLTLFERAVPGELLFPRLLNKFYAGARDERTLALLAA